MKASAISSPEHLENGKSYDVWYSMPTPKTHSGKAFDFCGHGNCHCPSLSTKSHCMSIDGLDPFCGPVYESTPDIYLPTGPDFGCIHHEPK